MGNVWGNCDQVLSHSRAHHAMRANISIGYEVIAEEWVSEVKRVAHERHSITWNG